MLTRKEMTGPWAGLPVAWKDNGRTFDEDVYRANVDRCCKAGIPGVYTAGTTGEFYAMEFDEWQAVTRATIEQCKQHGTPVMIGVTSSYTLGVQRRTAIAAELGADAIQLAVPYWLEVDDREIVPFFKETVAAAPGLALTVYDTLRSKKTLTLDMHRAIFDATGTYLAVKAAGTVGSSEEGCAALSEFINVWVNENEWARLGPHGAIGCASALVYMNPRYILRMFELLQSKDWDALATCCEVVQRLDDEGLAPFAARGFTDTAYDHLQGLVAGFLEMSPVSRGPYLSCTGEDVEALRAWMAENAPELLEL